MKIKKTVACFSSENIIAYGAVVLSSLQKSIHKD